ncbi:type IX secretion system membrane protein PorP/SprF [Adhaeribacter soli]|uniref:Type IX secretion system membrane protein PorP/SprF n=2 Tax=Adhaeribacter soli TaxID=2607655 RepID=A0A5N1J3K8_9BACT|nr:type IX secretion system membrane protein PorP/SprF [Adhaeribacter soli]
MRQILLIFCLWLAAGAVYAQQSAQYTQYIFNGLIINPAYAGTKEILNANAMYRSQWAGLEGAPTTQTFAADGALKNNRLGVGLQVVNDKVGAQGRLNILASGSVHLPVSYEGRLSFGLAGGVSQYSIDGSMLKTVNPNDPAIPNSKFSSLLPDAQAGVYFHTEQFYAGFSGANLIGAKSDYVLTPERHYFLTSGYVFNLGSMVKFKPSFLLKSDFKAPTNLDLNTFVLFAERLWLGASYRTGVHLLPEASLDKDLGMKNAVAGIVELYLTKKIKIGYAHDFTLTGLSEYASHEFSLGYYFLKKDDSRMLTPRYF